MVEMTIARTPTRATGGNQNMSVIGNPGITPTAIGPLPTFRFFLRVLRPVITRPNPATVTTA